MRSRRDSISKRRISDGICSVPEIGKEAVLNPPKSGLTLHQTLSAVFHGLTFTIPNTGLHYHSTSQQSRRLSNTQQLDKYQDWRLRNRETMAVTLVLIVMFYFHTGVLGEWQELASVDRKPSPSPAFLSYLQKLKSANMAAMDREVKNVPKSPMSASVSAGDSPDVKAVDAEGSINDSTELKGRVKRYQHTARRHFGRQSSPPRCVLGICRTLSLAHSMYRLNNNKGKDARAPKSTDDPHSFGKRRRRSLLFLLGMATGLDEVGSAKEQ
ncbi:uncharacterized protein LOC144509479 [Mustelus asterias]